MRTEGRCRPIHSMVHDLLPELHGRRGLKFTEQLNEVLARGVGVREDSTLHQDALLLNVYMLFKTSCLLM